VKQDLSKTIKHQTQQNSEQLLSRSSVILVKFYSSCKSTISLSLGLKQKEIIEIGYLAIG